MLTPEQIIECVPRITPQWLAGFFDGEGCVCASKRGDNIYNIDVSIAQTGNPLLLMMIAAKFPNSNYVDYKPRLGSKNAQVIRWIGRYTIEILEYIKDHSIIKKVQIEAALEIAYIIRNKSGNGFHNRQVCSQAEKDERERLAKIICEAKVRNQ